MKNATMFYTKEKIDDWSIKSDILFSEYLDNNKFYVDGWFKNKIFNLIKKVIILLKIRTKNVTNNPKNVVYKKYKFDQTMLINLIKKYRIDLNYIWYENPQYLIIGQDVFHKLFHENAEAFTQFQTEMEYNIEKEYFDELDHFNGYPQKSYQETKFWKLKVLIVPWINGCFLLPNI